MLCSDFFYVGVVYDLILVLMLIGEVFYLWFYNSVNKVWLGVVCVSYVFSKCLLVYVMVGYIDNCGSLVLLVDSVVMGVVFVVGGN